MRIIALSDIHGQLPVISESAEVMFICGDIINQTTDEQFIDQSIIHYINKILI